MTVKELMAHLAKLPPNHTVVVDLHSEYFEAAKPELITGYDNGGYVSKARTPEEKLREHGYVLISSR
jgi:hypothetical protein